MKSRMLRKTLCRKQFSARLQIKRSTMGNQEEVVGVK